MYLTESLLERTANVHVYMTMRDHASAWMDGIDL